VFIVVKIVNFWGDKLNIYSLPIFWFGDFVDRIYPIGLEIKDTTNIDRSETLRPYFTVLILARALRLECGISWVPALSGQTKDYNIGTCCFSAQHATLRTKSKDQMARNHNMCPNGVTSNTQLDDGNLS
jgi:hypothetical protein